MDIEEKIIIDAKDHVMGRLASVVAKELMSGNKVTVLRCEGIAISGSIERAERKYKDIARKRCVVNPRRGPHHPKAPREMFWRKVRGMMPYKTKRGSMCLERLEVFETIPIKYKGTKRLIVPSITKQIRNKPGKKWCVLGDLAARVGWKYQKVVENMDKKIVVEEEEAKNMEKDMIELEVKRARTLIRENPDIRKRIQEIDAELKGYGYDVFVDQL